MRKIITLFVALIATTSLWASNVITYTATSKLPEITASYYDPGLHVNAFNVAIHNHTFSNGAGVIIFEDDVTRIGGAAFYYCSSLTSINIPNSVTEIGVNAFYNCSSLESIKLPSGVKSIGYGAFENCTSLGSLTLPDSLTEFNISIIDNCPSLKELTVGENISTIDLAHSRGAQNISTIRVVSENKKFDSRDNCNAIIETATNTMVMGCSTTTFPSDVTRINSLAFNNIPNMTTIHIPSFVSEIEAYAFCGCSNVTSITVDEGNTNYDSRNKCNAIIEKAFNTLIIGCQNTIIPENITTIAAGAFENCTNLTELTIPTSVIAIEEAAFLGCTGINSLHIPSSVTTIEKYAFGNVKNIQYSGSATDPEAKTIRPFFKGGIWGATSINGYVDGDYIFNDQTETTLLSCSLQCDSINLPYSVIEIGPGAFRNCQKLSKIVLPNNVITIGDDAFVGCPNVREITLGQNITTIGEDALFTDCEDILAGYYSSGYSSYFISKWRVGEVQLQSVICHATLPPDGIYEWCENLSYDEVGKKPILYVPEESLALYKAIDVYGGLADILPIGSSAISENKDSSTEVSGKILKDGQLLILRDGKTYNAQGGEL